MKTTIRAASILLLGLLLAAPGVLAGPPRPFTPQEIRERIAAAGEAKDHGNAPVVTVLEEDDVRVRPGGLAVTESCRVTKILTPAGVRSLSVLRERYDPATNRVAIRSVRIHRKGGTVEEVAVDEVITQPSRQGQIFWGGKQHLLSLPRLEVGDSLEVRVGRIGFNIAYLEGGAQGDLDASGLEPPMPGHWHETVRFSSGHPVLYKRYSVHLPEDKPLQFEVVNGPLRTSVRFDGDHHVYTFLAEKIPARTREPGMVSGDDCETKVVMATVGRWEEKSRWFFGVNEGQFEADEAIRAKVAEITEGLTEEESIAACLHWVSDNIRYYGTSRGPREGFTLHRSIETFRDRGGVCKDIAGMLVTMLRVLGHEVYPALTMAGSRVEDVPADQFNHTVTVMRRKDGTFRILDPTWSPVSRELWSSREALQGLVYGTPEGQGLTLSPYFPPERNLVRVVGRSRIDERGDLTAKLRFDLVGYGCTYLRRNLHRRPPPERRGAVEEVLNLAPNAVLHSLETTDPLDYSRDSAADLEVTGEGYAAGGGGVRIFHLPLLSHPLGEWLIPDLMKVSGPKERRYGLRLRATRLLEYEGTVVLPDGWRVVELPGKVSLDSGSASLAFSARAEGNQLTYELTLTAKNHIVPPEDYPGFRKAIETMGRLAGEWVVCRIGEGGDDDK